MVWRMSKVRDISHHNTIENYPAFRAHAESVQIKITESTGFVDNAAARHKNGCSGMRRAPYHFARPISIPQQIAHFLQRKAALGSWERPDMLDCEFSGITGAFIKALKDEYRRQSGIDLVQIYIGLHDIVTTCPPSQWWDQDVYIQVARYRKIGPPLFADNWGSHLGFDHPGLSTYQWDNATSFYPNGPIGDVSFDRVFVGSTVGDDMSFDPYDLYIMLEDAAAQNPPDGKATRIRSALRTIMTGVPTSITEDDRNAIADQVTDNLIAHFHENPPTFTVDIDAISKAVSDDIHRRMES